MTEKTENKARSGVQGYFQGAFEELSKVTWPTKNQAIKLTAIVLVFTLVSAVVLGVLDYLFSILFNVVI